jgi:hypothetical protein
MSAVMRDVVFDASELVDGIYFACGQSNSKIREPIVMLKKLVAFT